MNIKVATFTVSEKSSNTTSSGILLPLVETLGSSDTIDTVSHTFSEHNTENHIPDITRRPPTENTIHPGPASPIKWNNKTKNSRIINAFIFPWSLTTGIWPLEYIVSLNLSTHCNVFFTCRRKLLYKRSHSLNILFTLPLNIVFISSDLIAVSVFVLTL